MDYSLFLCYNNAKRRYYMRSINELMDVLVAIKTRAAMKKALDELLTPAELEDVALRWQILKDLANGETQRRIASKYRMSLCKVTRGAKVLKNKNSFFRKILASWPRRR